MAKLKAKVVATAPRPAPITSKQKKNTVRRKPRAKKKTAAKKTVRSKAKFASKHNTEVSDNSDKSSSDEVVESNKESGSDPEGSDEASPDEGDASLSEPEDTNSEGSQEGDAYEVASILGHKVVERDETFHTQYEIQWKPSRVNGKLKKWDNTWEPESNLKSCEFRIAEYNRQNNIGQPKSNNPVENTPVLKVNDIYMELLSTEEHPITPARHNKLWDQANKQFSLTFSGRKRQRRPVL